MAYCSNWPMQFTGCSAMWAREKWLPIWAMRVPDSLADSRRHVWAAIRLQTQ